MKRKFSATLLWVCAAGWLASAQAPTPATRKAPAPPAPIGVAAPTQIFRRLLAMTDAEREQFLAQKGTNVQAFLRGKVQEYLALSQSEREARLQALELRAYMLPLMKMPAVSRQAHLESIPADRRKDVEQRLRLWDIMPPPLKNDVLQNETAIRIFVQSRASGTPENPAGLTPQQRDEYEAWKALPPERREHMIAHFDTFFGLDPNKQRRTLGILSDTERARLQPTLAALDGMTKTQREEVVEGFKKFKGLSPSEQHEFLRTAARWQAMTEKERDLWRHLAVQLRNTPPPPMPPPRAMAPGVVLATNR